MRISVQSYLVVPYSILGVLLRVQAEENIIYSQTGYSIGSSILDSPLK
jgi:hypothetical protein